MNAISIIRGEIRDVPVDELETHPQNSNRGDLGRLSESVVENGFYGRILVQKSRMRIIAGEHRYRALCGAGATEIPAEIIDVDDATALRILEADNAITRAGDYDEAQRAANLQEIIASFGTLAGSGADADDLDDILARLQPYNERDVTEAESPAERLLEDLRIKWGVETGQTWIVPSREIPGAEHRIICGDNRDSTTVAELMAGKRARLVYTDPPYGVEYESEAHGKVLNDDLKGDALRALVADALTNARHYARKDAAYYVWHASATRRIFEQALEQAGLEEKQYLVWAKETFVMGRADYHWQHEPCFYAQAKGKRAYFTEDRTQSTVWRIVPRRRAGDVRAALENTNGIVVTLPDGKDIYIGPHQPKGKKRIEAVSIPEGGSLVIIPHAEHTDLWEIRRDDANEYLHPTQKPAALAARAIMNSTVPGDVALDVFLGSGSMIIACEQTGRIGHGMDKNPRAVASALEGLSILGLEPRLEP